MTIQLVSSRVHGSTDKYLGSVVEANVRIGSVGVGDCTSGSVGGITCSDEGGTWADARNNGYDLQSPGAPYDLTGITWTKTLMHTSRRANWGSTDMPSVSATANYAYMLDNADASSTLNVVEYKIADDTKVTVGIGTAIGSGSTDYWKNLQGLSILNDREIIVARFDGSVMKFYHVDFSTSTATNIVDSDSGIYDWKVCIPISIGGVMKSASIIINNVSPFTIDIFVIDAGGYDVFTYTYDSDCIDTFFIGNAIVCGENVIFSPTEEWSTPPYPGGLFVADCAGLEVTRIPCTTGLSETNDYFEIDGMMLDGDNVIVARYDCDYSDCYAWSSVDLGTGTWSDFTEFNWGGFMYNKSVSYYIQSGTYPQFSIKNMAGSTIQSFNSSDAIIWTRRMGDGDDKFYSVGISPYKLVEWDVSTGSGVTKATDFTGGSEPFWFLSVGQIVAHQQNLGQTAEQYWLVM